MPVGNQISGSANDSESLRYFSDREADEPYDIYVGANTARYLSLEQIKALSRLAEGTTILLSPDDLRLVQPSSGGDLTAEQIKPLLPPYSTFDQKSLSEIYSALREKEYSNVVSLDSRGDIGGGPGVIVTASSELTLDYLRSIVGVNFSDQLINKSLIKEMAIFIAAHEFSHMQGFIRSKSFDNTARSQEEALSLARGSEITADLGAYAFIAKHPQWFPTLSNPQKAQAIVGGWRAMFHLLNNPSEGGIDIHLGSAFFSPSAKDHEYQRGYESIFLDSRFEVIKKVSEFLINQGALPEPEIPPTISAEILKRIKFNELTDANKSTVAKSMQGSDVDTSGILREYLKNLGITDYDSKEAEQAVGEFQKQLNGLMSGGKTVEENLAFFRERGVSTTDITNLYKQIKALEGARRLEGMLTDKIHDQTVSITGGRAKDSPLVKRIANPSNTTLNQFIATAEVLYKKGAFDDSPEQKHFVENLIAGGKFYLDPKALAVARAAANKASADPKTAQNLGEKKAALPTPALGNRPNYNEIVKAAASLPAEPLSTLPAQLAMEAVPKTSPRTLKVMMGA